MEMYIRTPQQVLARVLIRGGLLAAGLLLTAPLLAAPCRQAAQHIGIYQPWNAHSSLSSDQIETVAAKLASDGYTSVLLQWSRHGETRFWPADGSGWLPALLENARRLQRIHGLYADPAYFRMIAQDDCALSGYLASLRRLNLEEAENMHRQQSGQLLAGWYLPEEIDDLNWRTPQRQAMLADHLQRSVRQLQRLTPGRPVYASAFFGGHGKPQDFARMLAQLHRQSGIIWLIQDGQGVARTPRPDTRLYLHAISTTLPAKSWLGVVEVFNEQPGATGSRFCPASSAEIAQRRVLWCRATGQEAAVYFSLNQLNAEQLGIQNAICRTGDGEPAEP
ncbi:DUF4434 domain-containing protein [Chitinilyticum aquatile]|uniref:DUF4434 domain-containing protein n=1 Tax=Chitinilyticum aquatile TaxID=362520 RepID=UPI0004032AA5|nr:DUF4434 domain-containing protein [Chitinilyticum aquatile]